MTAMIIHENTLMIYVIGDDGILGLGQRFYPLIPWHPTQQEMGYKIHLVKPKLQNRSFRCFCGCDL